MNLVLIWFQSTSRSGLVQCAFNSHLQTEFKCEVWTQPMRIKVSFRQCLHDNSTGKKRRDLSLFYPFIYTKMMKMHMQNKDFRIQIPKWGLWKRNQEKCSWKQQKMTWNGYMNLNTRILALILTEKVSRSLWSSFVKADTRFFIA